VSVRWRWLENGSTNKLVIEWQEIDGPPVRDTSHSSYGTTIIRELIPFELGGAVELSFVAEGTKCRIEIPGDWTSRTVDAAKAAPFSGMPSAIEQSPVGALEVSRRQGMKK
jgi:hypothetical protein